MNSTYLAVLAGLWVAGFSMIVPTPLPVLLLMSAGLGALVAAYDWRKNGPKR